MGGRGGESFISPDLQAERIRAYARSRGFEIGIVHRELDRSGSDDTRPLFLEALARVARGESGGIVVAKLDRFARSALDALTALQQIEKGGGIFVSVEDGFDSSTAFGRAMMTILLALAELELARVRDVWDSAQGKAIARGIHTSPLVPAGYRRGDDGRLVPDAEMAPLVVEAFRRRVAGATYREIAGLLNNHALAGERGRLRASGVAKMLKSRVYLGEAYYGRYRNPAAHPAIVPMRLWLAAQSSPPDRFSHPAAQTLLSGMIRCAGCSHLMASSWTQRGGGGERRRLLTGYRCRGDRKTARCPMPAWVRATEIEALVIDRFFALLRSRRRRVKPDLERLERELAAVDSALARVLAEQQLLGADPVQTKTIASLAEAANEKSRQLLLAVRREAFADLPTVKTIEKLWPAMTASARRKALGSAFDAIMVERGQSEALAQRVHFICAGQMPEDFPGQGRPGPVKTWSASK